MVTSSAAPDHDTLDVRSRILALWLEFGELGPGSTCIWILVRAEQLAHQLGRDGEWGSARSIAMDRKNERDQDAVLCQQPRVGLGPLGAQRRRDGTQKGVIVGKSGLSRLSECGDDAFLSSQGKEVGFGEVDFSVEVSMEVLVVEPLFARKRR